MVGKHIDFNAVGELRRGMEADVKPKSSLVITAERGLITVEQSRFAAE